MSEKSPPSFWAALHQNKLESSLFSFAFLLVVLQALFVVAYTQEEKVIYFWDHAMYHTMARALFHANDVASFFAHFFRSFHGDYNLAFALPSLFGFAVFGEERLVYLLCNFFFWFLAYEIATALVLKKVFSLKNGAALVASFLTASLQPFLWRPLLEGFPDSGASAALVFALGFFISNDRRLRTALGTGLLLGLCILLRRHFVYAVFSLCFVETIKCAWLYRLKNELGQREVFWRHVRFLALSCLSAVLFLCALEFSYVIRAFATDYRALYKSYEKSSYEFFIYTLAGVGLFWVCAVASGFVLAWKKERQARGTLLYVIAFCGLSYVLWSVGPSQASMHYLLHEIPLVGSIGLTALGLYLGGAYAKKRSFLRYGFAGLVVVLLAFNSAWVLWFAPTGVKPNSNGLPEFLAAPRPPLIRKDYDQLLALGQHLITTTKPEDRIVVVGSSFILNQDLLRAVFVEKLNRPDMISRLLFAPEIDTEQGPPFDQVANGTVFIVPDKTQYHLDPKGQKVVTALAQLFPPSEFLAQLFQDDDQHFLLDQDCDVTLWRRIKPWPPEVLSLSMTAIRNVAPGLQSWVATQSALGYAIETSPLGISKVISGFVTSRPFLSLFFTPPLLSTRYMISFTVEGGPTCSVPKITIRVRNGKGDELLSKSVQFAPSYPLVERFLEIPRTPEGKAFLFLEVESASPLPCGVALYELKIEQK